MGNGTAHHHNPYKELTVIFISWQHDSWNRSQRQCAVTRSSQNLFVQSCVTGNLSSVCEVCQRLLSGEESFRCYKWKEVKPRRLESILIGKPAV